MSSHTGADEGHIKYMTNDWKQIVARLDFR